MPSYKLTYFDGRARIEVARQILYLADIPFEDVRVSFADWPVLKPTTPFGELPVLEVDGKPIPIMYAIYRYLAKEFGFAGQSPFETAWVDAVADQHADYFREMYPFLAVIWGFSNEDRDTIIKEVGEPARDKYFPLLEKIVKDNGLNGHFVGGSLTWVDLLIAEHVGSVHQHLPGFFSDYHNVVETVKKVNSTPRLKEWIEKRVPTAY
uniref:glutathione transferase n=1 Tax=Pristionchus pacificus TaxID=54126 RepID=A0A8R1Z3Q3_PRIPA